VPGSLILNIFLLQQMSHTQQHGGMGIMAAGVHYSLILGAVRHIILLPDGQGIHVGTNTDGGAITGANMGNHAGTANSRLGFNTQFSQGVGHQLGRPKFLKAQFRMLVDVTPQADKFFFNGLGLI
jgi:hypothetical protein